MKIIQEKEAKAAPGRCFFNGIFLSVKKKYKSINIDESIKKPVKNPGIIGAYKVSIIEKIRKNAAMLIARNI